MNIAGSPRGSLPSFAWNGIPEQCAMNALHWKPPLPDSHPMISSDEPFTLYWRELR
jgi:hypothetical protein